MEDRKDDFNRRIATRLKALRASNGLTLEELTRRSGVSRSMISLIERGEASPTAALLQKLATSLRVPLASLFDPPDSNPRPIARRNDQAHWRDPASGYLRRNLSPNGFPSPIQIVEVEFPPGSAVAFEEGIPNLRIHQQVWVLAGSIEIKIGEDFWQLHHGDCLAFVADRPTAFRNPTKKTARYAVVIVSSLDQTNEQF